MSAPSITSGESSPDPQAVLGLLGTLVFRVAPPDILQPQNDRARELLGQLSDCHDPLTALFGGRFARGTIPADGRWGHRVKLRDDASRHFYWEVAGSRETGWLCIAVDWHDSDRLYAELKTSSLLHRQNVLNMMPRRLADELRAKQLMRPRAHRRVTALFATVDGFPAMMDDLDPVTLITLLERSFGHFDKVVAKYGLFKVRSEHGSYFCVAGIPKAGRADALNMVLAALEMNALAGTEIAPNGKPWQFRFGLHTGPVVTGSVGKTSHHFDVWGNSVTMTREIEELARPGTIRISDATERVVHEFFSLSEERRDSSESSQGLHHFRVVGLATSYRSPHSRIEPNPAFTETYRERFFPDSIDEGGVWDQELQRMRATPVDSQSAQTRELRATLERLQQENLELERAKTTDPLTGLFNRRALDDSLQREWRRAFRNQSSLAALLLDVDHFKSINDKNGHLAGDEALKGVAAALSRRVARPGDVIARFGGDEFMVLLPDTTIDGAKMVAEGIREELSGGSLTTSIGIHAMVPDALHGALELLRFADDALYGAKRAGRNCARTFEEI